MAINQFTKDVYEQEDIVYEYARKLIERGAYDYEWFNAGGASVYHVLFGGADHADPEWKAAFNAARLLPEYAVYLAREMNGSMLDDSWGDVAERSGPSFMASAFANLMADKVLRILGEQYAEQKAAEKIDHERGLGGAATDAGPPSSGAE